MAAARVTMTREATARMVMVTIVRTGTAAISVMRRVSQMGHVIRDKTAKVVVTTGKATVEIARGTVRTVTPEEPRKAARIKAGGVTTMTTAITTGKVVMEGMA